VPQSGAQAWSRQDKKEIRKRVQTP
jgi:hypothetical protein